MSSQELGDRFFRHEYGRLVAVLTARLGGSRLALVEDAVQAALLAAVERWPRGAIPDDPSAWLYRVANNQLLDALRQRSRRDRLDEERGGDIAGPSVDADEPLLAGEVRDDLLRMLFACCDPAIAVEGQLVLALKTLCGFDVREIAARLFLREDNVYKRLARAREELRSRAFAPADLDPAQLAERLGAVQSILYLMFTEGHLSSHADASIRRELCDEAIRLTSCLAEHPVGQTPETSALLALMHLSAARLSSRQDGAGGLLLLEEQDRACWDQGQITVGLWWLARSAEGETFSRYHAEAGVAAEHCLAPSFAETRWDRVIACYELLDAVAPSALHTLNRAVAVAEHRGPEAALALLVDRAPPSWLDGSYLWAAVLADLHGRAGHAVLATSFRETALATAPSAPVRDALRRRLLPRPRTSAP